jgi:hypothetical protein
MPSDKYDLIGRLKAVEREHTALRFTTSCGRWAKAGSTWMKT